MKSGCVIMGKLSRTIIFLILVLSASRVFADAGYPALPELPKTQNEVMQPYPGKTTIYDDYSSTELAKKVFSLGRSIGVCYYHIIDLNDKSASRPFSEIKREYGNTFQALNVVDIILYDLKLKGEARLNLNKIRKAFYDALQNQDLNESKLTYVRDMFKAFYEKLAQDIDRVYSSKESWLLSLGFYTSFQLESLKSYREEKILLSGFEKIMSKRSVVVPGKVYDYMVGVYKLDKPYITDVELVSLKENLTGIINYFTNYSGSEPLFSEVSDLVGVWQGILFNPDKEKYDIRLTVREDLTAIMDIADVAYDVMIPDIEMVNNYFTFMFKPFGTEKLYLRFDAKLCRDVFSGEITDVLGEKGYWVLAMTDKDHKLSEEKLDKMVSYVKRFEKKQKEEIKTTVPVIEKSNTPKVKPQNLINKEAPQMNKVTPVRDIPGITPEGKPECSKTKSEKMKVKNRENNTETRDENTGDQSAINDRKNLSSAKTLMQPAMEAESENDYYKEATGVTKKLKSFFKKLFSSIIFW